MDVFYKIYICRDVVNDFKVLEMVGLGDFVVQQRGELILGDVYYYNVNFMFEKKKNFFKWVLYFFFILKVEWCENV